MRYFPINLDIFGRLCIVVGGGNVAERKVRGLLACSGRVKVISPDLTDGLTAIKNAGEFVWEDRAYQEGDLKDAFLVIAATDDPDVQDRVFCETEKGNTLLNVADVPDRCNFILPAVVQRGDLSISVSTSGKSPALAKRLREEFESRIGPEYEILLNLMGELRQAVLAGGRPHEENKILFNRLLHYEMAEWIRDSQWDRIENHIRDILGYEIQLVCLNKKDNRLR